MQASVATLVGRAFALILLLVPAAGWAGQMALVIGMGNYQHLPPLQNTLADARAVAAQLEEIGVDVTLSLDAPREELLATLRDFAFRVETADLALIYYAGHGVEVQGQNLLVPVDAQARSNRDLQRVSVSLDQFMEGVAGARVMRVVILDACRNNPFGDALAAEVPAGDGAGTAADTRSVAVPGLAPVDPDRGTLVAFAASRGQVSFDGAGDNSPYALALVDALGTPGLEIGLMFRKVRDDVLAETRNLQEPYTYGSLSATPFYLGEAAGDPPEEPDRPAAWAGLAPNQETQLVALAETGDTRSMLALGYMRLNPASPGFDPPEAVSYLERAAEAGAAEAQFELAKLYERGLGVPQDPARALALYEAAAAQGFSDAINDLGFLHYNGGLGLAADPARAIELFGQAADLQHPEALFNYAALIDDGLVPGKGPEEAGAYLYRALRSGSESVLNQLLESPTMFTSESRQALQLRLQENGFYDGAIDGSVGPQSRDAIRAAFGLEV